MRLVGINIPDNKRIEIALTYVFGIGRTSAVKILQQTKINPGKKAKDLSLDEANTLREIIEKNSKPEADLRREVAANKKRLKDVKSYRGLRLAKNLPVRGQSTKRNSRTVRGNVKKSVGSGRKPSAQKT